MHRLLGRAAPALALFLLVPIVARATVAPPSVRIRWEGERPLPARAGVEFTGAFRITASGSGVLENVRLEGEGWAIRSLANPGTVRLASHASRVVTFRAVPSDPSAPLFLRATFDGRPFEQTIRLDATSLERAGRRGRIAFADGAPRLTGKRVGNTTHAQSIRFHGRFAYVRDLGGPTLGADNIPIKILDDDSPDPFDEEIWVGRTDPNGNFDVTINWDDCDISGCDDPDIYLEVDCANGDVSVHADDAFNTLYGWSTDNQIIENFQGNDVDFGTIMPDDPSEYAAPHIYTSIVRAHRYSSTYGGMAPGNLIVLWPDNDDPTSYDQQDELIHIAPVRTWNEISHSHEFGHHLQNVFGTLLPPQYVGGHSRWCQMTATSDAWQEGWGNYFGSTVAEDYPATYGIQPWVSIPANNEDRWTFDGVKPCAPGGPLNDATLTEGFVDAFLRDIRDANPTTDDHDGGATDCDMDAMGVGVDEIFTVFRDDDPATVLQFIQKYRARYALHDQDLWSTARNISTLYTFAVPAPVVTSQPAACRMARPGETVVLNVQGNGSLLRYQWRLNGAPLTDNGSTSGSRTANLTLGPITATMGGSYDCVVSTCDGTLSTTSTATRLTVDAPPAAMPLVSWGENGSGQIGDGTTSVSRPAFPYTHLNDVIQVDAGAAYTMALRPNGSVWSWGREQYGELGNGGPSVSQQYSPAVVPTLSNILQVAAGKFFGMALQRNGTVLAWGQNIFGNLALGTFGEESVPMVTLFPGCVRTIAAGEGHSVALLADGTVWTAGLNGGSGALGTGTFGGSVATPVQVIGLTNVVDIKAAYNHTLALRSDGTVWAWGDNDFGVLGIGNTTSTATATQVVGLTGVRSIATSKYNSFAIRTNGECYGWGVNNSAGHGTGGGQSTTPQLITSLNGLNVQKIDGGDTQWAMALLGNGRLKVWGTNAMAGGSDVGVFNATTPVFTLLPIDVPNVFGVSGFAAGTSTVHAYGTVMAADAPIATDLPLEFALRASPNPARARTTLAFDLPIAGAVSLSVCDVAGRRVRSLVSEVRQAGRHSVTWDGRGESGMMTAAGVYFVRLEAGGRTLNQALVRLQ